MIIKQTYVRIFCENMETINKREEELDVLSSTQKLYIALKRVVDFFVSLFMFIPFLVLFLIVKLAYLFKNDNDRILYKQNRIGKDGKEFLIYKFRTMSPDAEKQLNELLKNSDNKEEWRQFHKLKNDPRITEFGLFLRKSSIDEFPQFINVLKGDMSIIGPRPLVPGELEMHGGKKFYNIIKPGITGWWACNGRSDISYDERLENEYFYIRNVSLVLDIKIIFMTISCVLKKAGAR